MSKIIYHKDYNWNKTSECKCRDCIDLYGQEWCGFSCEYQERQMSNPDLDYYERHNWKVYKKEYELADRFFWCDADFLMDFQVENRKHADGTNFTRRTPKQEYWLINFSEMWGMYYNPKQVDKLKNIMSEHGRKCISEKECILTDFHAMMENV